MAKLTVPVEVDNVSGGVHDVLVEVLDSAGVVQASARATVTVPAAVVPPPTVVPLVVTVS